MKIALIAGPENPVPPTDLEGPGAMIEALGIELVNAGHDVRLITRRGSTSQLPTYEIDFEDTPSSAFTQMSYVIRAYAMAESFDIVHDHTSLGPVYASWHNVGPVVATAYDDFMGDAPAVYADAARHCRVVGIANAQADRAHHPMSVIRPGIRVDEIEQGDGLGDENGNYLLFLGPLNERSGAHLAAQAARGSGRRLVIATMSSRQTDAAYFDAAIAPLLGEDVEFIGEVDVTRKYDLLAKATGFVSTPLRARSYRPLLMESLACGTPVISLAEGSAPEIVVDGKTGFVCQSELDVVDAFSNVSEISRQTCRDEAVSRFDVTRMTAEYLELYEATIAEFQASQVIDVEGALGEMPSRINVSS